MKRTCISLLILVLAGTAVAQDLEQNLELRSNKDLKQPGLVNPAFAGMQENLFRLLTNTDINSYSFMLEGQIPFGLGQYMLGYQSTANDYVRDNSFNLTYGRNNTTESGLRFRYGGALQFRSRANQKTDSDSAGIRFVDLNGQEVLFGNAADLIGKRSYMNLDLGASLSYKDLLLGVSVSNLFNPNVSIVSGDSFERRLPLSGNMTLGGFLDMGSVILFPHVTAVYNNEDYYAELGLKLNTPYFNLSGSYALDEWRQDFSASLGMTYKRNYFGVSYAQPTNMDGPAEFRVFLNSSLIRDFSAFQSEFAKKIKRFY